MLRARRAAVDQDSQLFRRARQFEDAKLTAESAP
jgi:hypothetical protein